MIEGSCLCGKVRYKYNGKIEEIAMCHCSQCRKAQGGAFATNSPVDSEKLEFAGVENIKEFQSSELKVRAFCTNCGSPLYSARSDLPGVRRLRIGSVETPFLCDKKYHIHTASKASWHELVDDYPNFPENL